MEALQEVQRGASNRIHELERRVASLEQDRDTVVNRHIERRLLADREKRECCDTTCGESSLSRAVRELRG